MVETRRNEGFDRVFDLVGGHGRFQWRLLLIISLQLIFLTFHHIGYTFLGAVPDHFCLITELRDANWTTEQIKQISIPRIPKKDNIFEMDYDNCNQYYFNYGSLVENSANFEEAYSKIDFDNATTVKCERWEFDRSVFKSTIPTQFSLVCGRRWLTATIQSSYMAGGLVGTIFFASVSDRFLGRQKTVFISLALVVFGGITASFATSYWMFLFLRFIISIGVSGSMQNCFILLMEHADIKSRALFGIFDQIPFAIGYMLLPIYAYIFRDWSNLQLAFGITSLSAISYRWILPDSPRWLATQGKEDEAIECLLKIAKVNGMPEPNREELLEIIRPCHEHRKIPGVEDETFEGSVNQTEPQQITFKEKFKQQFKGVANNFKILIKTPEIRIRSMVFWAIFLIVAMVYYGIVFAANVTSDLFLYTFLLGLIEIPAYSCIVPIVSKLGRRPTTSITFILTGISMIGLSFTPGHYNILRIILAMAAKLTITSAFAIIYLLGAELYPTEMRATGLAVGIFMGRMGAITAPYIADLMQFIGRDFPTIIFGVSALIAGIISLGLPETGRLEMTDQLYEVEKQGAEERLREKRHSLITSL